MWREKERKTQAEEDGQCNCRLEREGIVGRGDAKRGCVEATGQRHRPHMELEVGKYVVEYV